MNTSTLAALTATAALCAVPSHAQSCGDSAIDPMTGASVGSGDDVLLSAVDLGFVFTFPGGTVSNLVDIDTNGRILLSDPANVSDFSESDADFLGGVPTIAPYWDDLAANDVSVSQLADRTLITLDVIPFGGSGSNLVQVGLFTDGRISMAWSSTMTFSSPIIGITQGGSAVAPPTDLSAAAFMSVGNPTVFESTGFGFASDLAGSTLTFIPDGIGGYNTSTDCANVVSFGAGCPAPNDPTTIYESFDGISSSADLGPQDTMFTPNGLGGYSITTCVGCFEPNVGTGNVSTEALVLGDDELVLRSLPFLVTAPDGSTTADIQIDSNGRILVSGGDAGTDFSPSVPELLSGLPSVCFAWTDLSPPLGGTITLDVFSAPNRAVLTFDSVRFFGNADLITAQVQLFENGDIVLSTVDVNTPSETILVGISAGNGTLGNNAIDLSDDLPFDSGAEVVGAPLLGALTDPVLGSTIASGTTFDLEFSNLPGDATTAFVLVGNPSVSDLGALLPGFGLSGCTLLSDGSLTTVSLPVTSNPQILELEVPDLPMLLGFTSAWQSAVQAPSFGGAVGLGFSNALSVTLGF